MQVVLVEAARGAGRTTLGVRGRTEVVGTRGHLRLTASAPNEPVASTVFPPLLLAA